MKQQIKSLYAALPFKQPVFKILRRLHPPRSLYKHLHFHDEIVVPVGESCFKMVHYGYSDENELFWVGLDHCWEKVSLRLWRELSATSEVIFDIGANSGIFSLVAKTVNSKAQVFGFEPVPSIFEKYRKNCQLNHYDVVASPAALADRDGDGVIHVPNAEHSYAASLDQQFLNGYSAGSKPTPVKLRKLSSVIAEQKLTRVDLMKIDVESFEPQVLAGMGADLAKFRPNILIEVLSDGAGAAVEKFFDGLSYLYYDIDEVSKPRLVSHIKKSSHLNYLLCRPETAKRLGLDQ